MKESSIGRAASKTVSINEHDSGVVEGKDIVKRSRSRSSNGCFSAVEVSIEPGINSLKRLDSKKFKAQIKKWAKTVATYARLVLDMSNSPGLSSNHSWRVFSCKKFFTGLQIACYTSQLSGLQIQSLSLCCTSHHHK
ncbi:hypothetical protein POM88_038418 [Heracleum sosnowskyi]|uniref:Uncharacterized protein n=1 Tax=Heracleum sosnowskyi TaxID=360622 RepID=A0AAD8H7V5_9APIA|nr:hypothetical protein POM88_038418 [Heracleum sosnowskyi]